MHGVPDITDIFYQKPDHPLLTFTVWEEEREKINVRYHYST